MSSDNAAPLFPAFEQNNVPVVLAVNNMFVPYAGVFIQSLLDHASESNNYDIIIFERDISAENKRLLKGLTTEHMNVSVRIYDPSPFLTSLNYADEDHHFPLEVYYRIIAPHILNYSGRVITVDVDTLLKTDIARLISEDLEGFSVGGVLDAAINGMYLRDYTLYRNGTKLRNYYQNSLGFGMDDIKNYVGGGLLLFDCDKYIHELDMEEILNVARKGRYIYEEQDVFNVLMKGKIKALDFAWNVYVRTTPNKIESFDAASKIFGKAYDRAYENPYMIHWAGRPKPWVCPDVPWGNEWWQTALRTPFVGHIIARMMDELDKRQTYFRKRYGKEVAVWEPIPKGTD